MQRPGLPDAPFETPSHVERAEDDPLEAMVEAGVFPVGTMGERVDARRERRPALDD